ncbi:MAG: LexA family protein, partial [Candidatus Woesearchaeota archaeon]
MTKLQKFRMINMINNVSPSPKISDDSESKNNYIYHSLKKVNLMGGDSEFRKMVLLEFLKQVIKQQKYPPTIREISSHFKVSDSTIFKIMRMLERDGYIETEKNKSRAL